MKSSDNRGARLGNEAGQALVLFALFSVVLILFVGLGIDLGFAYVTKAQLAKAIDAASLAAISNYSSDDAGNLKATAIANATFWANYATNGVAGRATVNTKLTPTIAFGQDANSNLTVTASAQTQINTFFIGLLPQWKTLTVGDTATSTRSPVVMTLVLDRSGSMTPGGTLGTCVNNTRGGLYLPDALQAFISVFDEKLDQAAVVTFASTSSNDVPMTHSFKTGTPNVMGTINRINGTTKLWAGGTCSMAGLTNALVIQNSVNTPNAVHVVVFFTDGRANMILGNFNGIPLNFGGQDPIQVGCSGVRPGAGFWRTNAAETVNGQGNSACSVDCGVKLNCTISGTTLPKVDNYTDLTGNHLFCADLVTLDATNRCALLAKQLRTSAVSNYVYTVGLAAAGATAPPTIQLLQIMANDPSSPVFDQTQPVGAAFLSDGNDLTEVFQQVASDIILRLIQ